MKFAVIVFETAADFAKRDDPTYMGAHGAYAKALAEAGIAAGGAGLQSPSSAVTVKLQGGKQHVHDGPFADSKEQVGGIYIIDVPDMETAMKWAARCPNAALAGVEVRPLIPPMPPRA